MVTSTFELFKIGVGPSSSHTMGPMTAAADLVSRLDERTARVEVLLYGSLALTGKGHAADRAILLGLMGNIPAAIDPDAAELEITHVRTSGQLALAGKHQISFDETRDVRFLQRQRLDFHSNAMVFAAFDLRGAELSRLTYYSVGGGAIVSGDDVLRNAPPEADWDVPHRFSSGEALLQLTIAREKTIAELMRENEETSLSPGEVSRRLTNIRDAMSNCIDRGIRSEVPELPGGLRVKRRAPDIHRKLIARQERALSDPLTVIGWINLWALAVNEENAAGGRVVTAPTNGAAGIVPAVLRYYERFAPAASQRGVEDFLLTAAAIGSLFKENASISEQRSVARERSGSPARWQRPAALPPLVPAPRKSKTRRRLAWSTTLI